jgi:large subunit ribosomal protein L6
MLTPTTGRQALQRALASTPSSTVTLPGFLVPAFQTAAQSASSRRPFSATTHRPSKLGRTPLSVPPGVDLAIGDLFVRKDMTSYLRTYKRKITVTGPLGE